jgi:tetratricopeptide (TPR) repeat protein
MQAPKTPQDAPEPARDAPTLWQRIRRTRMVQVALVFAAVSWGVLQAAGTAQATLLLPQWLLPTTAFLLFVGFVVVMATAWVQGHPLTDVRERAGEVPTDWQVAFRDLGRSVAAGRLPHLTWGRAFLGGVVALSLAFGAAGAFVLVSGPHFGPRTVAAATDAGEAIAVLPFSTAGADLEGYREGMVDLLSTNLDGLPGLRTVASRTVMARWRAAGGEGLALSLDAELDVAASAGARFAVVGSIVAAGPQLRLAADVVDLASGRKLGTTLVEGRADAVLELVDQLSVGIARELLGDAGDQGAATRQRLESLVTASVPALQAYLEGEAAFRRGQSREALEAFERAVGFDSTFALAHWRQAQANGWLANGAAWREGFARAGALAHRLPPREAVLLQAARDRTNLSTETLPRMREYVRRYPDDPEGWHELGEYFIHMPTGSLPSEAETYEAFRNAVDADPTFPPYYYHLVELELARGDSARVWRLIEELRGGLNPARADRDELVWHLYHGPATEMARRFEEAPPSNIMVRNPLFHYYQDEFVHRMAALRDITTIPPVYRLPLHVNLGEFERLREAIDPSAPGPVTHLVWGHLHFGVVEPGELRRYVAPVRDGVRALGDCPAPFTCAQLLVLASLLGMITDDPSGEAEAFQALDAAIARLESRIAQAESPEDATELELDAALLRSSRAVAVAARAMADDRPADALRALQADPAQRTPLWEWAHVALQADALAALGRHADAVHRFDVLLRSPLRAYARLRLGEIHEATGDRERAREHYEGFLTLWRDADPDLAVVERVRERVAALGG